MGEKKRRNALLCRLLSTPDVASQGVWHRSYPGEQPRCPTEKILLYFSKVNWNGVFTTDTSRRSYVLPKPRVRRKTMGKWQASWWEFFPVTLLSNQGKKRKPNICGANIHKPSLDKGRHKMCGNGYCAEARDGFKPLTHELFCFQWPPWNCSRWKWGQSTDIWMTVCLLVRHNHQLSDPVKGLVKAICWFSFLFFACMHAQWA